MKLRIGSRGSALAIQQSELVMAAIRRVAPEVETELVTYTTTGDRIRDRALDKIGGKGLFVKELDMALLRGEVDLTVHSLKDMPMEQHPDLPIRAYCGGEEPLDALLLPQGVTTLKEGAVFGCAGQRRGLQLRQRYPGCQIKLIRGNVPTRIAKLDAGEYDAIVLACAGLKRLGLEERIVRRFSPEELLPAAGQGVMAVQCRRDKVYPFLEQVNQPLVAAMAQAERAFVRGMGGGCSDPVAAHGQWQGTEIVLTGWCALDGVGRRLTLTGSGTDPEALGLALARRMKEVTP
jgi:hydroxymethylbilane synthase